MYIQRQRCRKLGRFNCEKNYFYSKKRAVLLLALSFFTTLALQLAIVGLAPGMKQKMAG
jgi:hypothetical protein